MGELAPPQALAPPLPGEILVSEEAIINLANSTSYRLLSSARTVGAVVALSVPTTLLNPILGVGVGVAVGITEGKSEPVRRYRKATQSLINQLP